MSGEFVETRTKGWPAAAATAQHLMVKLNGSGKLAIAGATDQTVIGTAARAALAADEKIAVHLLSAQGTMIGVATAAFAEGAKLYLGANGTIDDAGTIRVGTALQAAGAAGDWVEFLPWLDVEA